MSKQQKDIVTLSILSFLGGAIVTLAVSNSANARNDLKRAENIEINQGHEFIWNDDIESVPATGYVKIDTIINNAIYLSPDE